MNIEIFTICDFAQDVAGKLTIVGTFDSIFSGKLPAIHPTCSIVARIRFSNTDAKKHSFQVSISDDSGNKEIIPPFSGDIDLRIPSGEKWAYVNIVVGIGRLKLLSYGEYSVNLSIDKKQVDSRTLSVRKLSKKPDGC